MPAATTIEAVHPATREVPANLLRLYVVFSAPMRIGEVRDRVRLLDDEGRVVDRAFLELQEELWDPSRRRLTLLFDPGRIKRGLKGHDEMGAPLQGGRRYRLVIDGAWRDGSGRPLAAGVTRELVVGPEDRAAPDVAAWTIEAPESEHAPLVVRFPDALDRALLAHAIAVVDATGAPVPGSNDVRDGDRTWVFVAASPWRPGGYGLRVSTDLEDVAGNSLRRLFDADLTRERPAGAATPESVTRAFVVRLAPPGTR